MATLETPDAGPSPQSCVGPPAHPVSVSSIPMPTTTGDLEPPNLANAVTMKVNATSGNSLDELTLEGGATKDWKSLCASEDTLGARGVRWNSSASTRPGFDVGAVADSLALRVEAAVEKRFELMVPKLIESLKAVVATAHPSSVISKQPSDTPSAMFPPRSCCSDSRKGHEGIRELEACLADVAITDAGKRMLGRRNEPDRSFPPSKSSIQTPSQAPSLLEVSRNPSDDPATSRQPGKGQLPGETAQRSVEVDSAGTRRCGMDDRRGEQRRPIPPPLWSRRPGQPGESPFSLVLPSVRMPAMEHGPGPGHADASVEGRNLTPSPEYQTMTIPDIFVDTFTDVPPIVQLQPWKSDDQQAEQPYQSSASGRSNLPGHLCSELELIRGKALGEEDDHSSCGSSVESPSLGKVQDMSSMRPCVRQPTNIDLFDQHLSSVAADAEEKFESLGEEDSKAFSFNGSCGFLLVGLSPWRTCGNLKRCSISGLAFAAGATLCVHNVANFSGREGWAEVSWVHFPLSISAVAGVFGIYCRGHSGWAQFLNVLNFHTWNSGVQERWVRLARWDALVVTCCFLMYVGASFLGVFRGRGGEDYADHVWKIAFLTSECIIGLFHMSMLHCMLTTCRAIVVLLDNFGNRMVNEADLSKAIFEWKLFQALLRKCTASIEWTFIVEIAGCLMLLPAVILDHMTMPTRSVSEIALGALPAFFVFGGVLHLCLVAASISDKCRRVPSLVNALSFGEGTQRLQQHIVEYIVRSNSGFFIADIKLSTESILKLLYTWGLLVFGVSSAIYES